MLTHDTKVGIRHLEGVHGEDIHAGDCVHPHDQEGVHYDHARKLSATPRQQRGLHHVEVTTTAMDTLTTAAFLHGNNVVDYTIDDGDTFEVYIFFFDMNPNNMRDHMVDQKLTLHRRGYTAHIMQVVMDYMMDTEEYNKVSCIKLLHNPLTVYKLNTWDMGYVYNMQFMVHWPTIAKWWTATGTTLRWYKRWRNKALRCLSITWPSEYTARLRHCWLATSGATGSIS